MKKAVLGGLLLISSGALPVQALADNPVLTPDLPAGQAGSMTPRILTSDSSLQGPNIPGSIETGFLFQQQRSHTLLNPQGRLITIPSLQPQASLRLRPFWRYSEDVQFRADGWLTVHTDSSRHNVKQRNYLSEALVDFYGAQETIFSAGVNTLKWGTGYSWNPSNPLADPKSNITDRALSYQSEGDPYVGLEWGDFKSRWTTFVSRSKLRDPALGPQQERSHYWGLRRQFVLDNSDLLVAYTTNSGFSTLGSAYSITLNDQLELHAEAGFSNKRHRAGISRQLIPLPGGNEVLYQWQPSVQQQSARQILVGGQYTFADQTNIILEYQHNGAGYDKDEYAAFLSAMRDAAQRADNSSILAAAHQGFLASSNNFLYRLLRNYGFARIYKKAGSDTELGSYLRYGFEDKSFLQGFYFSRQLTPATTFRVHMEYYGGAKNSETRLFPTSYQGSAAFVFNF